LHAWKNRRYNDDNDDDAQSYLNILTVRKTVRLKLTDIVPAYQLPGRPGHPYCVTAGPSVDINGFVMFRGDSRGGASDDHITADWVHVVRQ